MHSLAAAAALALALASDSAGGASAQGPATLDLEGAPLSIAALQRPDGAIDVLLAIGRDVDRFRLEGRKLSRIGRFRAPVKHARPLRLDAGAAASAGSAPRVAAVMGEDVRSTDQGTDTLLHAFLLSPGADGALAVLGGDRKAWVRFAGGTAYAQPRGAHAPWEGPVRPLSGEDLAAAGPPVAWAGRGLLEATPLPGGAEALALDRGKPVVVDRRSGERVPGTGISPDLGAVAVPTVSIRLEQPISGMGPDRFGREFDRRFPVPPRVAVADDGGVYAVLRGRVKGGLFGRASGQDALVRLDWRDGALELSRPYPGVETFVLDFAIVERPGGTPLALLLANDKEDGAGRAYLVVQEPR